MEIEQLLARVPEYAKDIKLNFTSVLNQAELTEQQTWGTAVATAIASRNLALLEAILSEAGKHLSPQALYGCKSSSSRYGYE